MEVATKKSVCMSTYQAKYILDGYLFNPQRACMRGLQWSLYCLSICPNNIEEATLLISMYQFGIDCARLVKNMYVLSRSHVNVHGCKAEV